MRSKPRQVQGANHRAQPEGAPLWPHQECMPPREPARRPHGASSGRRPRDGRLRECVPPQRWQRSRRAEIALPRLEGRGRPQRAGLGSRPFIYPFPQGAIHGRAKFSDFTLNFNPGARGNDKAPRRLQGDLFAAVAPPTPSRPLPASRLRRSDLRVEPDPDHLAHQEEADGQKWKRHAAAQRGKRVKPPPGVRAKPSPPAGGR